MNFEDYSFSDFVNKRKPVQKKPQYIEPEEELDEEYEEDDEYSEEEYEEVEESEEFDDEYEQRMLEERRRQKKLQEMKQQQIAQRPVQKTMPRPVQRPIQQPQEIRKVVAQPVQPKIVYVDQYGREIKNYTPQQPVVEKRVVVEKKPIPQPISKPKVKEHTIESEANENIEALKRKVESIFYRFGIQGLERLDETLQDTIDELMYPDYKENYIKNKKLVKTGRRDLKEMRRLPAKKIIKKKPVVKQPQYVEEPIYEEPEEVIVQQIEEPIYEEPIVQQVEEIQEENPIEQIMAQVPEEPITPPKKVKVESVQNNYMDYEQDEVTAALSLFNQPEEEEEEEEQVVENEGIEDLASQILEGMEGMAQPIQQMLDQPNTTPKMIEMPEVPAEEHIVEEQVTEEVVEQPKPKRKRKAKTEVIEENTANEEN